MLLWHERFTPKAQPTRDPLEDDDTGPALTRALAERDKLQEALARVAMERDAAHAKVAELASTLASVRAERDTLAERVLSSIEARGGTTGPLPSLPPDAEELELPEPDEQDGGAPFVRPGTREGYVELLFSEKPSYLVRAELKSAGFRWSSAGALWYGRADRLPASLRASAVPALPGKGAVGAQYVAPSEPAPERPSELRARRAPSRRSDAPRPGGTVEF